MTIAIDVREACRKRKTGKGAWVFGCVSALLEHDHSFVLLTDESVPPSWGQRENVTVQTFSSGIRWHFAAAKYLKNSSVDAYLSTTSFIAPYLLKGRVKIMQVIHDLIAFREDAHEKKAQRIEKFFLPRIINSVDTFLCISQSTADDLQKLLPQISSGQVHIIHAGPMSESVSPWTESHKAILCIATLCPRKNQLRLIEAFLQLPESLQNEYKLLLVGGRGWDDDAIVSRTETNQNIEWKGYVSDDEYNSLLQSCSVFAYPSLYEGFGLPVLDALQSGMPVLTSSRGSLAEVAGDAAFLVDPENVDSIANGLKELLSSEDVRQTLSEKGPKQAEKFSWNKTANLLLQRIS